MGARKPSDAGLYFQWGDAKGYSKEEIKAGKKKFASDWSDYKWSIDGSSTNFTKYKTPGASLELEDDAAHANMGGSWHMPTPEQIRELINETTSEWTTQDGVNGRLFTSKTDKFKSIFIPAAGLAWDGSLLNEGSKAYVWSSMLKASFVKYGQYLDFYSSYVNLFYDGRYYGFSVRGVLG